jgi:hypothetical protein
VERYFLDHGDLRVGWVAVASSEEATALTDRDASVVAAFRLNMRKGPVI